jgi:hypothetical protein
MPLAKTQPLQRIIDTPARHRLVKEIGKRKLSEIERAVTEEPPTAGAILETPARARLRKEIGREALSRIEAQILSREL